MLNCKDATRLADEALEHRLPFGKRVGLRFHLMMCSLCDRYNIQIGLLHDVLGRYAEKEIEDTDGPGMPDDTRDRLRACIRKQRET